MRPVSSIAYMLGSASPDNLKIGHWSTAVVTANHQCAENLESLRSEAALSGRFFHGFGGRSHWTDRAERFWEIHIAAHSSWDGRARRWECGDPQATAT